MGKQWKQWKTLFYGAPKLDGDCSHEIKRYLLFGRKAMTNLDSILKRRHITLPTNVPLVKTIVFPVVMYGCESWTICFWTVVQASGSNQPILMEINPEYSLEGLNIPGNLHNPRIKPKSPELQADSLPSEPPEKPMSTGLGNLSLLQGLFPTQKLNQRLLHHRWILYQLN